MDVNEIIAALRRMKVNTGSLVCWGCGHEHNCGVRGCAILREAADALERLNDFDQSQSRKMLVKLQKAQAELDEMKRSGWISVKDRLPEYPGHYLVCTNVNYWHGGCLDVNENHKHRKSGTPIGYDGTTMSVIDCYYDCTGNFNRACNSHITHWMPLPEPPKEDEA